MIFMRILNQIYKINKVIKIKSFIKQNFSEKLFVQFVDAVAVVNNFEAAHHVTGQIGFFLVSHLFPDWVLVRRRLPHFKVVIFLCLHSAFQRGYWGVGIEWRLTEIQAHFLRILLQLLLIFLFN